MNVHAATQLRGSPQSWCSSCFEGQPETIRVQCEKINGWWIREPNLLRSVYVAATCIKKHPFALRFNGCIFGCKTSTLLEDIFFRTMWGTLGAICAAVTLWCVCEIGWVIIIFFIWVKQVRGCGTWDFFYHVFSYFIFAINTMRFTSMIWKSCFILQPISFSWWFSAYCFSISCHSVFNELFSKWIRIPVANQNLQVIITAYLQVIFL